MKSGAAREDEELRPEKHTGTVAEEGEEGDEEEDGSAAGAVASEGAETPLGAAFTCSRRPTAEYCRRLVVMETARQSRLLVEL